MTARLPSPYQYSMEEVDGVESDRDGSTVAVHSPRNRNIKGSGGTETSDARQVPKEPKGTQRSPKEPKGAQRSNDAEAGQAAAPWMLVVMRDVPDIDEGFVFLMDEDNGFYAAQDRMMAEPKVSWTENDNSGFYATPPLPYPMQFDANGKRPKETSCDSRWLQSSYVRQQGVFAFDM